MTTSNSTTQASCLCGAIKFQYTGPPLGVATELCHCVSCQKWTGSAFTSNVTIEKPLLHIIQGEPSRYTTTGLSGNKIHFVFCGDCGSGLWNEPEATPQWICIKAGTIDDAWVRSLGTVPLPGPQPEDGAKSAKHVDVEFFIKDRVGYQAACPGAKQEEKM
ncbi:hypothetical protein PFICI_09382 [Pestalotiopsis fici W106-1]|uniref:CENP-V/GFA domain-containing protein n=1 Tax=Pestalotiopsis fici (strain W106-1 / CGMCC3.15140) TaxID=1229662 RepID=W3X0H4_PESFW|nr:uncharacterized protein PFICI_09382 [Pestalotiopsis fici W106-1]ETS79529.1 hypothetical protein PFICI_09382 [Pestalotiopsis fici W106-1]